MFGLTEMSFFFPYEHFFGESNALIFSHSTLNDADFLTDKSFYTILFFGFFFSTVEKNTTNVCTLLF